MHQTGSGNAWCGDVFVLASRDQLPNERCKGRQSVASQATGRETLWQVRFPAKLSLPNLQIIYDFLDPFTLRAISSARSFSAGVETTPFRDTTPL